MCGHGAPVRQGSRCLDPTALGGTPFEVCLGFLILLSQDTNSALPANELRAF